MSAIVYCYHNIITGKKYIGVTTNESRRKSQHRDNVKVGRHSNLAFYRAVNKYGWDSFVYGIMEEVSDTEQLDYREEYYITKYETCGPRGYNMTTGGKHHMHTEESRLKLSNKLKGRVITQEHRDKLSIAAKGRVLSKEWKDSVSEGMKQTYKVEYTSGEVELVTGIKQYCKERGYTQRDVFNLVKGRRTKPYRDIVSITKQG